jgi:hypothetical protein
VLSVCGDQIAGSVPEGVTASGVAIGYEPLWAIGSGHMRTSEEIAEMHAHIRECLAVRLGPEGKGIRILYGGSVKPTNARDILALRGWRRVGRRREPESRGISRRLSGLSRQKSDCEGQQNRACRHVTPGYGEEIPRWLLSGCGHEEKTTAKQRVYDRTPFGRAGALRGHGRSRSQDDFPGALRDGEARSADGPHHRRTCAPANIWRIPRPRS